MSLKWSVRICGNPNKGWIIDGAGNKVTNLVSSNMCRMIVRAHNKEIEYLEQKDKNNEK